MANCVCPKCGRQTDCTGDLLCEVCEADASQPAPYRAGDAKTVWWFSDDDPTPKIKEGDIVELVKRDLSERRVVGIRKYGKPLIAGKAPSNGLSPLENAYEEVLDLACYLKHELTLRL